MRNLAASLQVVLAAGYVLWVVLPGHTQTETGLALWVLALAVPALVGEAAWRRGHQGDLTSVARVAGLLMLVVALGLLVVVLGIEALVPSLDF